MASRYVTVRLFFFRPLTISSAITHEPFWDTSSAGLRPNNNNQPKNVSHPGGHKAQASRSLDIKAKHFLHASHDRPHPRLPHPPF
jgi:hypothetical protein